MLLLKKDYKRDKKLICEWMDNQLEWTMSLGKDISNIDSRLEIVEIVLNELIGKQNKAKKVKNGKKEKGV